MFFGCNIEKAGIQSTFSILSRLEKAASEAMAEYMIKYGVGVTTLDWTPANNDREAFKQEYLRMQTDQSLPYYPEGYLNPINYNLVQSPGKKYIQEDGR